MVERSDMRKASPEEAKKLGIPPAYTNVMVAVDPKADLQATAFIPKTGKPFYRYSKWRRVRKLAAKVEKIEARILRDAQSGPDRELALCARLVLLTGMRNGGDPQGEGESYGASSLQLRHISVDGDAVRLQFLGKKQVPQDVQFTDRLLAGFFREKLQADAYVATRRVFGHEANATLRYMKSVGAEKVHDIRTWRANTLASALVEQLLQDGVPKTKKGIKLLKKAVATQVASILGNNPSQALKSYIDPDLWRRNSLDEEAL